MSYLHHQAAVQLANDCGWEMAEGTIIVISLTQSPHPWSPDLTNFKPLAIAIWTRDTGNVNLRPLAAKGSMKSNSTCTGHTKLKENYTVQCASASGIVCFGTASSWVARQPRVSPSLGNRAALHY
eukprot:10632661-Heterocapsa_arctica.AAC.1